MRPTRYAKRTKEAWDLLIGAFLEMRIADTTVSQFCRDHAIPERTFREQLIKRGFPTAWAGRVK